MVVNPADVTPYGPCFCLRLEATARDGGLDRKPSQQDLVQRQGGVEEKLDLPSPPVVHTALESRKLA